MTSTAIPAEYSIVNSRSCSIVSNSESRFTVPAGKTRSSIPDESNAWFHTMSSPISISTITPPSTSPALRTLFSIEVHSLASEIKPPLCITRSIEAPS